MSLPSATHTAFSDAIENGDADTVGSLVQQYPELLDHPYWTPPPLHCAVLWDQPKIAQILLDGGADIEIRDPDRSTTPLRYAVLYCKTQLISLLLSRGANAGPIIENGTTALELAKEGAAGVYEDYDDMPTRDAYDEVVELIRKYGVE